MICYHCGARLGAGSRCLNCGADVSLYRRIIRISNTYYNMGLERAKARDMTKAVEYLETSLHYNKHNTEARNLLGLCYFETGEICEALSHWIVSKNLQPENNACDMYLEELKSDRTLLDNMSQGLRKYNQALEQAGVEGSDLAVITLKRVIKQSPHLVKAYGLLALIHIHNGEYTKANRVLKKLLEIDRRNPLALEYSKMIQGKPNQPVSPKIPVTPEIPIQQPLEQAVASFLGDDGEDDTRIPRKMSEYAGGMSTVVAVVIGMLITMFLYQFVIIRTVNRDTNAKLNQQIAYYDARLAAKSMEVQTLQDQLDALTSENNTMKQDMKDYTSEDGVITQFDKIMQLANTMINNENPDVEDMISVFKKLSRDASRNKGYRRLYDSMYQYLMVDSVEVIYQEGLTLIGKDYWTQSIKKFEKCLDINPDFDKAIYYLGMVYQHKNDNATAYKYYAKLVKEYPDSEFYSQAVKLVGTDPKDGGVLGQTDQKSKTSEEEDEDE